MIASRAPGAAAASRGRTASPFSSPAPSSGRAISRRLLAWYRREKRELPWRGTSDPYRIWVSEVMLQQTTVAAVRGRYESFLARFPDVRTLADASEDSVLSEWSGLGYYARARNLRRAAGIVVREHGGRLPSEPAALRTLPGFGEYMSSAVASLAFGARISAADANVIRVVSRLFAIRGRPGSRAHRRLVLDAAALLLPARRPGDATAALMDLGQAICLPRRPRCPECPLRADCAAFAIGEPDRFPERDPKPPAARVAFAAAEIRTRGRVLLLTRPAGWLSGMWEFPSAEGSSPLEAFDRLTARIAPLGFALERTPAAGAAHTIMRRRLEIRVYRARRSAGAQRPVPSETARWFSPAELDTAAIPTLTRKIARAVSFLPEAL
ncbi:MAG: A/G-specific adenine glycosylase [Acidobacteriota bacterium]